MPSISVLDLSPVSDGEGEASAVRDTVALARAADRLGFHRIWLAEHHGGAMVASSAPEVLIARIAAETQRIRVGSGGMMLPNHTPLHVAEQFKVLEALYPDRIDLGIGRAPGTDQRTALALRRSAEALFKDDLPAQLTELFAYAGIRDWPSDHPLRGVVAAPVDAPLPPVFLLGSSDFSARLAGSLGLGFAFAAQINPEGAVSMLRLYRDSFQPSDHRARPHSILAHAFLCAESDAEAQRLAAPSRVAFRRLRAGRPTALPTAEDAASEDRPAGPRPGGVHGLRMIVGAPGTVREIGKELITASGADELMAMTSTHGIADRIRSFELLAEAFGL